ncbi:hypothetical protein NYR76_09525 [Actinobacillus equuli subsp. equuli]|uniref:hypothetical protein n=1 Tax=Actinobacillus equuli TaxID=718 RepID=UPI00244122B7|nr:hypothetical protein [Actinobacillus equuli]WGE65098.1 hypothetical protein NYR76_09525 [Actinobacillus equuli subsp. equuli]
MNWLNNMIKRVRRFSEQEIRAQLNSTLGLYRSHKKTTVFVEGITDKEFFVNFLDDGMLINFVPLQGKENIMDFLVIYIKERKYKGCAIFIVDVDYDYICSRLKRHEDLVYSFYCSEKDKMFFNDIESYLIINYFNKVYQLLRPKSEICDVIKSIEIFSRRIGKFRAADEILNTQNTSIIDGVNLFEFVSFSDNDWNMVFNESEFRNRLEACSPRKLDIDELFSKANELDKSVDKWFLSRGHDIAKIVHEFFLRNTEKYSSKEESDLEVIFRISSEKVDFWETNVGKKLLSINS